MVSVHRTPHLLCCLPAGRQVGHLKYREYVCIPAASHLQHPVNAYSSVSCRKTGVVIPLTVTRDYKVLQFEKDK